MNWLKAKRLIRRKPYLLDPYRCRSAEEAQKILDEEGVLSPDALLSAARGRAGMSEAEWEAYTGISSEEMRRKIERLTPIRIGKVFSLSRRAAGAPFMGFAHIIYFVHGLHSYWSCVGSCSI